MRLKSLLEIGFIIVSSIFLLYSGISSKRIEEAFLVEKIEAKGINERVLSSFLGKDLRKIKEQTVYSIFKSDPFVKEVQIKKIYPHTLFVEVIRRKSFACMLKEGVGYLVDDKGEIIKKGCLEDLPVFVYSSLPMKFQLEFIKAHEEEMKNFQWVKITSPFTVEVKLKEEGWVVLFPLKGFSQKLKLLLSVKQVLKTRAGKFSFVDFTYKGKLYLRRK